MSEAYKMAGNGSEGQGKLISGSMMIRQALDALDASQGAPFAVLLLFQSNRDIEISSYFKIRPVKNLSLPHKDTQSLPNACFRPLRNLSFLD